MPEKNPDHENPETNKPAFSDDSDEFLPEEILEAVPEDQRGKVASMIRQTMITGVMSSGNPLADKITSEHITEIINRSDARDNRDREERKSERNYSLLILIIVLAFVTFLIVFLVNNENLLINILIAIFSFVGGIGAGQTFFKKKE